MKCRRLTTTGNKLLLLNMYVIKAESSFLRKIIYNISVLYWRRFLLLVGFTLKQGMTYLISLSFTVVSSLTRSQ